MVSPRRRWRGRRWSTGWTVTAAVISGEALTGEPGEWIFSEAAVVWYSRESGVLGCWGAGVLSRRGRHGNLRRAAVRGAETGWTGPHCAVV